MPNNVFLGKDGLVHCILDGGQSSDKLGLIIAETEKLMRVLREEKKPVLILVDLTRIANASIDARNLMANAMERNLFDKVAIFGASAFVRHAGKLLIFGSRKAEQVRFFSSEAEAKNWLLQEPTPGK